LNCSMISVALMPLLKRKMPSTASRWSVPPEPSRRRKGIVGVGGGASPGLRGREGGRDERGLVGGRVVSPSPLTERGAPFQNERRAGK
jgi:hypothetical protein